MAQDGPRQQMGRMITGTWLTQMVYVAAKLGIADLLHEGPKTADELAAATGTHARSLYRLLRALASLGVFTEGVDGRFASNPLGETLRREDRRSLWAMAVLMGEEHHEAWGDFLGSIRSGEVAFDKHFGKPIFEYLAERPDQARLFDAAMTAIHGPETQAMLDAYDLAGVRVLADIGGGNGLNLVGTLARYPEMTGVLFDLAHVVDRARANLEQAGLADRCRVEAGDFFRAIPVQADAYVLRHIIHDWDDERSGLILRNVREAMPDGARLLLVEHVLLPGDTPSFGKLLDLNMLVMPGGLERTAAEYRRLYEASGFRLTRIVPIDGDLSVIEGVKA